MSRLSDRCREEVNNKDPKSPRYLKSYACGRRIFKHNRCKRHYKAHVRWLARQLTDEELLAEVGRRGLHG